LRYKETQLQKLKSSNSSLASGAFGLGTPREYDPCQFYFDLSIVSTCKYRLHPLHRRIFFLLSNNWIITVCPALIYGYDQELGADGVALAEALSVASAFACLFLPNYCHLKQLERLPMMQASIDAA
jgi:hypothetical protein